jgi:hypothetical protein
MFEQVATKVSPAAPSEVNGRRSKRPRASYEFVRLPVRWIEALAGARLAATCRLALYLLLQDFRDHGVPLRLSNRRLTAIGISRGQKWRGLRELEERGLVEVARRPHKAPIVSLLKS